MSDIRIGKYHLEHIGSGMETNVYRPKNTTERPPREKKIVIKDQAGKNKRFYLHEQDISDGVGFNEQYKQELQEHYQKLCQEYGSVILRTKFVKNPKQPELNLIVQPFVEMAEPADIFAYFPVDIEAPELQTSIRQFVETVKKNLRLFQEGKPSIVPDFIGVGNLALTKDYDRMVYVDSGLEGSVLVTMDLLIKLAQLSLLGGVQITELQQDAFFRPLFERIKTLTTIDDAEEFYQELLEQKEEWIDNDKEIVLPPV